ncbi:hypothetical protein ACKKBH_07320 [Aeromonas dhakensis]|uniref:hypothetical protein n=1 Tax=Aeromonas dhakensis TaxID=196024 RepID=UPI0038D1BFC0
MTAYLKNDSLKMEPLTDEERIGAARDPLTTPEQLYKLSMDDDACVRYFVAGNRATPIEAITRLAHDDDDDVSELAINSAVIQPDTLSELSNHTNVVQRAAVARHPLTPMNVLIFLSTDVDRHVRANVARNPTTPLSVLNTLSLDEAEDVRVGIAGNPKVSPALLIQLLERTNHDDIRVLAAAAGNRTLPSSMLVQFVSDERPLIRMSAASNPLLKIEQINELLLDSDEYVRKALMENAALHGSLSMCSVDALL